MITRAWARMVNRLLDAVGRAAGFCMADTWQPSKRTYAPMWAHTRCGKLRRNHASGWHRSGNYKWVYGQQPIHDVNLGSDVVGMGTLPRWLRGRHRDVAPRRRARQMARYAAELELARKLAAPVNAAVARAVPALAADAERILEDFRKASQVTWQHGAIPPFDPGQPYPCKRHAGEGNQLNCSDCGARRKAFYTKVADDIAAHDDSPRGDRTCSCGYQDVTSHADYLTTGGRTIQRALTDPQCPIHGTAAHGENEGDPR